jgi:predicted metal-dependent hydrolase
MLPQRLDEAIERFVRTKISGVKKQIGKFDEQPRQSVREYVSGETLYVWGKQYYLQTIAGNNNTLILSGEKAVLTVRKESSAEWTTDIGLYGIIRLEFHLKSIIRLGTATFYYY